MSAQDLPKVVILDNFSKGHRGAVTGGDLVEGDLGDQALLGRIFSERKIDVVMSQEEMMEKGKADD